MITKCAPRPGRTTCLTSFFRYLSKYAISTDIILLTTTITRTTKTIKSTQHTIRDKQKQKREPNNYITHKEIKELQKEMCKTVCHHCR